MSRKVYVNVVVRVIVNVDEGVSIDDVIGESEHQFVSTTPGATIEDTEIVMLEVQYSK